MNKNAYTTVKLEKGEMNVYDFGAVKLHAYRTDDPIADEVFVLEKAGQAVILESPCFFDSNRALAEYLKERKLTVAGMLLAYHMAGASFLPGTRKYATRNADEYGHSGGGKALIENFTGVFGNNFDGSIHTITDFLEEGEAAIGGIRFRVIPTQEAFDVEIPEINTVYTHMLGHDCHSIVAGAGHADALIGQLEGFLAKGYTLVLTSHYTPEDLKDVETKIAYLRTLKDIAERCSGAEEFKRAVQERYGTYSGENYLDMTAGFFFG